MNKIRKGDEVVVITGRDKGRRGTVIQVLGDDSVLVENVNMVKRHTRPNPQKGTQGGIVEKEATSTSRTCCSGTRSRRRATAWASGRSPTARACVSSSPTTKSWTPESARSAEHGKAAEVSTGTRSSPSS